MPRCRFKVRLPLVIVSHVWSVRSCNQLEQRIFSTLSVIHWQWYPPNCSHGHQFVGSSTRLWVAFSLSSDSSLKTNTKDQRTLPCGYRILCTVVQLKAENKSHFWQMVGVVTIRWPFLLQSWHWYSSAIVQVGANASVQKVRFVLRLCARWL